MEINWLWDSSIKAQEAIKILRDAEHPKFKIYMEKFLSRNSNPAKVFDIITEETFVKKWPYIKKRMRKDRWLKDKVLFWQTIYERVHARLKEQGIKIREYEEIKISPVREKIVQQIKDIRIKLGYTQRDIAKKLGVIQQYISKIETGRENISLDTLKRIADVYDKKVIIELK